MNKKSLVIASLVCVSAIALSQVLTNVSAQSEQEQRSGGHQGPPPEAFTVCENKSEGTACSMNTPRGTMEGTCKTMRDKMVCVPEGHGEGSSGEDSQGPPPRNNN